MRIAWAFSNLLAGPVPDAMRGTEETRNSGWSEAEHPRGPDGKFGDTLGSGPSLKVLTKAAAGRHGWLASSDPKVRAATLWTDHISGKDAIARVAQNKRDGKTGDAMFDGVDLKDSRYFTSQLVKTRKGKKQYTEDDLKADIESAADWIEHNKSTTTEPQYRGMRVESLSGLQPGMKIALDNTSWSSSDYTASSYASYRHGPQGEPGARDHWVPVMIELAPGAEGIDTGSHVVGRMAGSKETVISGNVQVISIEEDPKWGRLTGADNPIMKIRVETVP